MRAPIASAVLCLAALLVPTGAAARPTDPTGADDEALRYDAAEAAPFDSEHFRIHYVAGPASADAPDPADAAGGTDANGAPAPNGVPDYVDDVSADAEAVWRAEVVDRGFAPPPRDDSGGVARGGDGRYDIYLIDFDAHGQAGLLGLTVAEPLRSRRTYLVLDDDYADAESPGSTTAPADRRRVTLAHEFFHAIQDGYGPGFASLPEWLAEGTATWMESDVYPQISDNRWYLDSLVGTGTEAPLWSSKGVHVYGTWWFVRAATARHAEGAAWLRRLLRRSAAAGRTHRQAEADGGIDLLAAVSGGRASLARLLRSYAVDNLTRWFGPRLDLHEATLRPGVWWTSPAKKLTALQATYWRLRLPGRRVVVRVRGDGGLVSANGVALVLGGRRVRTAVRHVDGDTLELRGTVPADLPERVDLVLTQARALEGSYEISALAPPAARPRGGSEAPRTGG